MKKSLVIICLIGTFFSCKPTESKEIVTPAKQEFNEAAETDAIMKVIENETKCFFEGNYECWASNWSHESYALQAWNNDNATSDAAIGWDSISKQGKDWIEKYYKNGKIVIHPIVKRDKPVVKYFNDNTAYLFWKQYNADKDKKYYRISQEIRLMEKKEGAWKIVNVSAFWDVGSKIPLDILKIN